MTTKFLLVQIGGISSVGCSHVLLMQKAAEVFSSPAFFLPNENLNFIHTRYKEILGKDKKNMRFW